MSLLPADSSSFPVPASPETTSAPRAPRRVLLPPWFSSQSLLLWFATLPQIILLLINLRTFRLIQGDLVGPQPGLAYRVFALELGLLLIATMLGVRAWRRPRALNWSTCLPLCAGGVAYLWYVASNLPDIIPDGAALWIVPEPMQFYYQFVFVMPLLAVTGFWMCGRPMRWSPRQEVAVFFATVAGAPLAVYLAGQIVNQLQLWPYVHLEEIIFVPAGAIMLAGFTRGCLAALRAIRHAAPGVQMAVLFLVGLAAPLGGLRLNREIPFPHDFQSWPVYAMAALNGIFLLLPRFASFHRRRAVWLAQCALFPFTLYFFLVFLPFLPLSVLAMIIYGAGLLVLTPTALFLLHGQLLLDGFRQDRLAGHPRRSALLACAACTLLPALYVGHTMSDRFTIRRALDYFHNPDYRQTTHFTGRPDAVRRSLEHLRDFKAGLQLPFLSEFYNWAVFDNLVLPDEKMKALYQAFLGRPLPEEIDGEISLWSGRPRRGGLFTEQVTKVAPPTNVRLDGLTATTVANGPCERTSFALELQGTGQGANEYAAAIKIPEGVFVSGFWLKIGAERVPGRLFEKKTALWVYQQIARVARRDPGILVYRDAQTIDLRVFPITGAERRFVELEILYPAGMHPALQIGDRAWRAEGDAPAGTLTLTSEGSSALALTPEAITQLPRAERTPYLHFILDRSVGAKLSDAQILTALQKAAAHFPKARECLLTEANYELSDLLNEPAPIASLELNRFAKRLPRRGGFLGERALKHALLSYGDHLAHAAPGDPWLKRYPIIVVLGGAEGSVVTGSDLADFARHAPDAGAYYQSPDGATLHAFDFQGKPLGGAVQAAHPVALLQAGEAVAPCALDRGAAALIHFAPSKTERSLSVLELGAFRPLAATATLNSEVPYARGINAAQRLLALTENPSLGNRGLTDVVNFSRETGLLLSATSYIVVESTAQWEMLRRKEKQKLKGHTALEIEETPEPTGALLLLAGGAMLLSRRRPRVLDGRPCLGSTRALACSGGRPRPPGGV